jgi:hypothetical protein
LLRYTCTVPVLCYLFGTDRSPNKCRMGLQLFRQVKTEFKVSLMCIFFQFCFNFKSLFMAQFLDSVPRLYDSAAIRRSSVLQTKINIRLHCANSSTILVKRVCRQTMFLCLSSLRNPKGDGISKQNMSMKRLYSAEKVVDITWKTNSEKWRNKAWTSYAKPDLKLNLLDVLPSVFRLPKMSFYWLLILVFGLMGGLSFLTTAESL